MTTLVWLRDDLRLDDQPAVRAAAKQPALFVFVHDENSASRPLGGASRWWLGRSLEAFGRDLEAAGGRLDVVRGDAERVIPDLAKGMEAVYWTRRYGGPEVELDTRIKASLGGKAQSFNGQLLREPWEVKTEAGASFKVFTPYWRRSREMGPFEPPHPAPKRLEAARWPQHGPPRAKIADLGLYPAKPDWSGGLAESSPGEAGALARLKTFLDGPLEGYPDSRDRLDGETTSRLSPHLRFGEISPRRIVATIEAAAHRGAVSRPAADKYLSEIGWREFSYALLHEQPDLATRNWSPRFDAFPWRRDEKALRAWRKGKTGYPVVDAGMRELWTTGYMHNRVRMIAASFLIKHLMLDWRVGEAWFWDTLCDADPANNAASWQWVAGSGADAAPYFRVFNPVLQGEKFDPDGAYVRRWVPELAQLDARFIHAPWKAPRESLAGAGVTLGRDSPEPIVDHEQARARALRAFAELGREAQRKPTARKSAKNSG
jgi:deoxyribodipyrimidine photo-lyase